MRYGRDWTVPSWNLGPDLHPTELDVVALACRQTSTLNRVDDDAGRRIANDTASFPVGVRASGEVVCMTVQDSVPANDIRGECRVNVKVAIFDERVVGRIGRHLKLVVSAKPTTVGLIMRRWVRDEHTRSR